MKDMLQSVPAPMLDGIGSLRSETWLYDYLSSPNPQAILPSRLKKEYQMPSYAALPEGDRHMSGAISGKPESQRLVSRANQEKANTKN